MMPPLWPTLPSWTLMFKSAFSVNTSSFLSLFLISVHSHTSFTHTAHSGWTLGNLWEGRYQEVSEWRRCICQLESSKRFLGSGSGLAFPQESSKVFNCVDWSPKVLWNYLTACHWEQASWASCSHTPLQPHHLCFYTLYLLGFLLIFIFERYFAIRTFFL